MVKYRPHRGSLDDSMKEYKEFNDISEMLDHIIKTHKGFIDVNDIVIGESMGKDNRINWFSWRYVCTKRYGKEIYDTPQCIGMCDLCEKGA